MGVTQHVGWEKRSRGGRYYTRSRKVGGRVVRQYIGRGPAAECAATEDAAARAEREAAQAAWRAEMDRLAALDKAMANLDAAVDAVVRDALTEAGYHQHHRGDWRRRRGS